MHLKSFIFINRNDFISFLPKLLTSTPNKQTEKKNGFVYKFVYPFYISLRKYFMELIEKEKKNRK